METKVLTPQGVPVYTYENPHLHTFCLSLYVKAGSLYETKEQNGATHLWEHVVFRKLNHHYHGEFYRMLDKLGLSFNACTYREFVTFEISGAPQHIETAIELMALVLAPVELPAEELALEKERIYSEIREKDEKTTLDYFTQKLIWKGTTLAQTVLGKKRVLRGMDIPALKQVQDSLLTKGNFFFYLTGSVRLEDVRRLCERVDAYPVKEQELRQNLAPKPKAFFHRGGCLKILEGDGLTLRFSFDVDAAACSTAELYLLYDILACGDMALLYQELSEKTGYVYGYDAHLEHYSNLGCLYFTFEVRKKNLLGAVKTVISLLNSLKTGAPPDVSLALPSYMDNAQAVLDDDRGLNWNMAYECHILQNPYKSVEEKAAVYSAVTPERIQEIAREIFTADRMVLTAKTKKSSFPMEEVRGLITRL